MYTPYVDILKRRALRWHQRTLHVIGGFMDEGDFFQIGMMGLMSYQGELNRPLAQQIIDRRIIDVLRNHGLFSRKEVQNHKETGKGIVREFIDIHDLPIRDGKKSQLDLLIKQNALERLRMCLDAREVLFLERHLAGHTLKQIGHILNVTESRACQLLRGIEQKGRKVMAFKSEESGKWKVFMALFILSPEARASVEEIAKATGVKTGTVENYLRDFARIIPDHVEYKGKPPLCSFQAKEKTAEEIYKLIKNNYKKKSRNKGKKQPVVAETPIAFAFPPEVEKMVQIVPVEDIIKIKSLATQILNPIVAFRFDQTELYHNVIREQQRLARTILENIVN